jgi:hypothetical protein
MAKKKWNIFKVVPGHRGSLQWLWHDDQGKEHWISNKKEATEFGAKDCARIVSELRSGRDNESELVYDWNPC